MSLPVPDGKDKYNPDSEYAIELNERQVNLLNNIREASLEEFQEISLLLHEIANKGYKNSTSADSMLRAYFIEDANNPKYNQPQSYENGIIGSFYHALKDGRNMIHAFQAMDDPVIKNISKTSPKGKKDHNMNHLNPYTDVNGMIVNSVGKDGIAIVAVGLKGYAAVTDRLNQMKNGDLENLKLNSDLAIQIDNVIGETGAETILIPKGFDLKNMQNVVGKYLDENFSQEMFKSPEDYQDFRNKYLNMLLDEGSSDSLLSVLLTSATDNAKELVLGKINASLNTLGMYVYSVVMGVDLAKFTRFMTNPIIDKIINLSNQSITDSSKLNYSIDKAIKDVQNEYRNGTMYSGYLKDNYAESILRSIISTLGREPGTIDAIRKESNGKINLSTFFNSDTARSLMNELRTTDKNVRINSLFESRTVSEEFDDELAGELDSEDAGGSSSIDPISLFRWYDDSIRLKNEIDSIGISKEEKENIISLFQRIKKEANALKTLGSMLGINQSLKRTDYEFYKYNNILTDYINSRLNEEGIKKDNTGTTFYYLTEDGELATTKNEKEYKAKALGFDFEGFLNNPFYQENIIKAYGQFTNNSELNILEYLAKSNHFMEMIRMSSNLKEEVYPKLMVKFRSLSKAINQLTKDKIYDSYGVFDKGIPEDVFNGLSNYFGDYIIQEFLNNADINIKPIKGDIYNSIDNDKFVSKVSGGNNKFYLHTLDGRTSFTSWFENVIVSKIKNGITLLEDGTEVSIPELIDNKFLISVEPDSKQDSLTKEKYYFLKPRIEYSTNMSSADSALLNDIIVDFKKLKDIKYGGYNLQDLFFLYNLIVNRNKSLRSSFTYILSQGIEDNPDALHNQYNNFVTELDRSSNYYIDIDINDIKARGIVPKSKILKDKGLYKTTMFINNKFNTVYFDGRSQFTIPSVNLNKNIVLNTKSNGNNVEIINDIESMKSLYNLLNSKENKITIKC